MIKSVAQIVSELNQTDEHQSVEAKSGAGDSVLETICAFCNEPGMGGGTILIGVEKEEMSLFPSYEICGVDDPEKVSSELATQCATVFNTPIRPQIRTETHGGKNVIVIHVSEASQAENPIYFKKKGLPQGAFRRIASTDQKCTEDDLAVLFNQRQSDTYDESVIQSATMEDIDSSMIDYYRSLRQRVNPAAEELNWSDEDLLGALSAAKRVNGELKPTLTGILLFGSRRALRRLFPMIRVDYIRIPGKEWVENPDERFSTVDMRGSLLQLVQRLQDQIYEDLPKAFALEEGQVQASSQSLPSKVLREAIVNALMHASYRMHQPIQVLRYSNRIEIRNPGYSLKNDDQLGEPGSRARNPKIAAVFHETNLAETKGSGIRTMRRLMEEKGFAPPTFESDRGNDLFTARLLLHHFLTAEDLNWLSSLEEALTDAQKRGLIFVRESGAIDNSTYRQINGVDTLTASSELRKLRDIGLLEKKGRSNATYYVAGQKLLKLIAIRENAPQLEQNTPQVSANTPQADGETMIPPVGLQNAIDALGPRPRKEKTEAVILQLCQWRELSADELANLLQRKNKKDLAKDILKPMIARGVLVYTQPEMVNHPQQKYRAANQHTEGTQKNANA